MLRGGVQRTFEDIKIDDQELDVDYSQNDESIVIDRNEHLGSHNSDDDDNINSTPNLLCNNLNATELFRDISAVWWVVEIRKQSWKIYNKQCVSDIGRPTFGELHNVFKSQVC